MGVGGLIFLVLGALLAYPPCLILIKVEEASGTELIIRHRCAVGIMEGDYEWKYPITT